MNKNKKISEYTHKVLDKYHNALNVFKSTFEYHMQTIIDEILRELNPIAIYLVGSFGRNEGSLYVQGSLIKPLRDYDILIIVNRRVKKEILDKISLRIHKKLDLEPPTEREVEFKGFMVSLNQLTFKDLQRMNLLKLYELKHASKLLYGVDVRKYIKIDISNISKYNGILILLGKAIGLLGLINLNMLINENYKKDELIDLVYECLKTYVEIPTVLSLLDHSIYRTRFLDRCIAFYNNYDRSFPILSNLLPNLKHDVLNACLRRMILSKEYIEKENIDLLFQKTIKTLYFITLFYIAKAYNRIIYCNQYGYDLFKVNLGRLYSEMLYDLFDFYIRNYVKLFNSNYLRKALTYIIIFMYLRWCSLKIFIKLRKAGLRVKLRILFMNDILLRLWFAGLILLTSFKNENLEQKTIMNVIDSLSKIINLKNVIRHISSSSELDVKTKLIIFEYLRRKILKMLMIVDKTIHMKE